MPTFDTASKIGSLLNSWTKIIVTLGGAVISCALAYYKIYENEANILREASQRAAEIKLLEERGDKRYNRAMNIAEELKSMGLKEQDRVRELEIEVAKLKGKYESKN